MLPQSAFEQKVNTEGSKATYSAVVSNFTPTTAATDIAQLVGSASKTITIVMVRLNSSATTAAFVDMYLYKRTAVNTGGTQAAITIAKHDSQDPAPTAAMYSYSANPSALGTGAVVRSEHVSASSAAAGNLVTVWDFTNRAAKAIKLQGVAESLCINFNGATPAAGTNIHMTIEWTEE